MVAFCDLMPQKQADSHEGRIKLLKSESAQTKELLRKTFSVLETYTSKGINGKLS